MKRHRQQKGSLWKSRGWWYLRFRDEEQQPDGTFKRVQKAERLAPVEGETRSKESQTLLSLMEERMAQINGSNNADIPMRLLTIGQFVEQHFLPMMKEQRRRTTYITVESIWRGQLKDHVGYDKLRDFDTPAAEAALRAIVHNHPEYHHSYVKKIKTTLSSIFKYARRRGAVTIANPVKDVLIPPAVRSQPRGTYTLEDVNRMLALLEGTARVVVAVAAFAGLRRGELQGLLWEDYDGEQIFVRHNCTGGVTGELKTDASNAPVPVIAPLRKILAEHRTNANGSTYMFPGSKGTWRNLQHVAEDEIIPKLKLLGLDWYGWHAFRRGLASNLYRLGVPDKHVQAILRHANVNTTMKHYVRTSSQDSIEAMARLEQAITISVAPQTVQ
jgi:integrase